MFGPRKQRREYIILYLICLYTSVTSKKLNSVIRRQASYKRACTLFSLPSGRLTSFVSLHSIPPTTVCILAKICLFELIISALSSTLFVSEMVSLHQQIKMWQVKPSLHYKIHWNSSDLLQPIDIHHHEKHCCCFSLLCVCVCACAMQGERKQQFLIPCFVNAVFCFCTFTVV